MRIIAGKYKKTPILTLPGEDITRPTRDMVKEALFSSIMIYSDTSFLDLFAGSGSIGLEALSRGAEKVVFNDLNKDAVKIINKNLAKVNEKRDVYNLDYQECLAKLENSEFDYIYVDPPYRFLSYEDVFYYVGKYNVLRKAGIMIFEVEKTTELNDEYLEFRKFKEKRYGINKLLYFRRGK
ncbi:MAG: 16S rRNA (guanine(966)-N(2))-methyltransferase RsmD [Erysipelotrichaceae bacterium]|nr:16S rRNA (guanine(966)-N(2))-methyltransferase RsmD [Erysipelotrichaceae bacterium]MBP5280694.1 16S rRNA (guanine(966)-N(2))-methyltransferase RsmD [Erysipelotrichaceae bacterium]